MPQAGGFSFGPYQLDRRAKRLARDGVTIELPGRLFELLVAFLVQAGELISKDALIQAVWDEVAVTDNSLAQAVSQLRMILDSKHPDRYIVNVRGRGYRFVAPVTRHAPRESDTALADLLAPHRAFTQGRAALETLERSRIELARAAFEDLVANDPDDATAHVGLANACALEYEATRADVKPNRAALVVAVHHAREACRLNPDYGEAWATLGFVLERVGERDEAVAALRHAAKLEPDNWRHQLRLAYGSWGEERLRAARCALAIAGPMPMAHLLTATVYVARGVFDAAERDLDAGVTAIATPSASPSRFSPVALHYVKGLLCVARGAIDEALASFDRELAGESRNHLYSRECCANTWYAIGACRLLQADRARAAVAFREAIARVPTHPMAHAGLAIIAGAAQLPAAGESSAFEVVMAQAAVRVWSDDVAGAVDALVAALRDATSANAGWLIPVDPLLQVPKRRGAWTAVLTEIQSRAL